jgi:hypothetical protein
VKRWLWIAGGVAAVLALAWFDGGEQPLQPISQAVALPEGEQ